MKTLTALDDWLHLRTADFLMWADEWLNLEKKDILRLSTVLSLSCFAVYFLKSDHPWVLSIWVFGCGLDWRVADKEPSPNEGYSWSGWFGKGFAIAVVLASFYEHKLVYSCAWLAKVFWTYVRLTPKPPSKPGKRRREFLEKMKIGQLQTAQEEG